MDNHLMSDKVAIIMVAYNSMAYIDRCIEALSKQSYANTEIIIIDNNPTSHESDYIKETFPHVNIINSNDNIGFSAACNLGIKAAAKMECSHVVLLNIDTVASANLIELLVKNAGDSCVTTGYIYTTSDKQWADITATGIENWYSGGHLELDHFNTCQSDYEFFEGDNNVYEVEFISGCCMCIPIKVINEIGGFDESLFMYYEDVDYCFRLAQKGIRMIYVPKAYLWHAEGGSSAVRDNASVSQYYLTRNKLYVYERYCKDFDRQILEFLKDEIAYHGVFSDNDFNGTKRLVYLNKGFKDYLCNITGRVNTVDVGFKSGFYEEERSENGFWRWAIAPRVCIEISHYCDVIEYAVISFRLTMKKKEENYSITVDGVEVDSVKLLNNQNVNLILKLESKRKIEIQFAQLEPKRFNEGDLLDSRTLYYCLIGFEITTVQAPDLCIQSKDNNAIIIDITKKKGENEI